MSRSAGPPGTGARPPGSGPAHASRSLLRSRLPLAALASLLALVGTTPLWSSTDAARVVVDILVLVAVTQLWSYLAGGAGVVSLGVHGFAGLGAYALWFLADRGTNPVLAVGGAGLVAGLAAAVAAPLVLRSRPGLAAVASWAVGQAALEIVTHSARLGGDAPSRDIAAVVELGSARDGVVSWLAVVVGVAAVAVVYAHRRSGGGLALVADGDDAAIARGLSLRVGRARAALWLAAAAFAGTAGALVAFRAARVTPAAFDPARWTMPALAVAGIGGLGTIEGPLAAAVLYVVADELVPGHDAAFALTMAVVGAAGLVVGPDGWWGWVRRRFPTGPFPVRRVLR